MTYGIQKAGIEVIAGVDIDESCKYAYESNNHSTFINKSVTEITGDEINLLFGKENIKLLMGCAPCQPFSNYRKDKKNRKKHKDWFLLNDFLSFDLYTLLIWAEQHFLYALLLLLF